MAERQAQVLGNMLKPGTQAATLPCLCLSVKWGQLLPHRVVTGAHELTCKVAPGEQVRQFKALTA